MLKRTLSICVIAMCVSSAAAEAREVTGTAHAHSRIEAKMRCLKSFGERIAAGDPDRQTAEIHIRIAITNRFSALGTPEIVRVA